MRTQELIEATESELSLMCEACSIEMVSFEPKLAKLDPADGIRRYNRIRIKIRLRSFPPRMPLFLTVRRHGSRIGEKNFYSEPLFADDLQIGEEGVFDLMSFDAFNEQFESISVEMCRYQDYKQRKFVISPKNIERARKLSTRIQTEIANQSTDPTA